MEQAKVQAQKLARKLRPYITRRFVSLALVAVGTLLLGYVGLEYWGMYRSQKNLESQWQQQAATMSTPGQPQLSPDQMLTRILIPKIQMDAIVVEGASRRDL